MTEQSRTQKNLTQEMSDYLDDLRESGVTNMFVAAPYLQEEFALTQKEARNALAEWMASF